MSQMFRDSELICGDGTFCGMVVGGYDLEIILIHPMSVGDDTFLSIELKFLTWHGITEFETIDGV